MVFKQQPAQAPREVAPPTPTLRDVTPIVTDEPVGHLVENDLSLVAATGDPTLRPLGYYLANAATSGAASGANSDITSLTGLTTPLSVAQGGSGTATPGSGVAGTVGGFRNLLRRNGGLEIWQRGAGGAASFAIGASAGSPYTADGWYLSNGANQASVVSQVAGITNGSQWCAKILRNNGQTGTGAMIFAFPLDTDELYSMLGQFVRLSLTMKAGANWSPTSGNIVASLNVGTGTPVKFISFTGPTAPIPNTACSLTTTATRYQMSSNVIVPITSRQAEIDLVWSPVGTASADDSFYIDDVQLEIVPAATGYVASDFERLNFQEQLTLCQRHYFKTFKYATAPAQNVGADTGELQAIAGKAGAAGEQMFIRWPVKMRVAPTLTWYNPQAVNAFVRDEIAAVDTTGTSATAAEDTARFAPVGNAATVVGNILGVHLTAEAGI